MTAEVDWRPTDISKSLRAQGASQTAFDAAGRVKRIRVTIDEWRADTLPPPPRLSTQTAQLAAFYSMLGNWFDDRALLLDANEIDYRGEA